MQRFGCSWPWTMTPRADGLARARTDAEAGGLAVGRPGGSVGSWPGGSVERSTPRACDGGGGAGPGILPGPSRFGPVIGPVIQPGLRWLTPRQGAEPPRCTPTLLVPPWRSSRCSSFCALPPRSSPTLQPSEKPPGHHTPRRLVHDAEPPPWPTSWQRAGTQVSLFRLPVPAPEQSTGVQEGPRRQCREGDDTDHAGDHSRLTGRRLQHGGQQLRTGQRRQPEVHPARPSGAFTCRVGGGRSSNAALHHCLRVPPRSRMRRSAHGSQQRCRRGRLGSNGSNGSIHHLPGSALEHPERWISPPLKTSRWTCGRPRPGGGSPFGHNKVVPLPKTRRAPATGTESHTPVRSSS